MQIKNYEEISHACYNSYYEKDKRWCEEKGSFVHCWLGMYNAATMENSMEVPQKN